MRLLLPAFGVLFASASCCCLGDLDVPPIPGLPEPSTVPVTPPSAPTPPPAPDVPTGSAGLTAPGLPEAPPTPGSPAPSDEPPAATTASGVHEGTLLSADAHTVRLQTTGGQTPPVGAAATLSKWVHKQVFGADMTMWLGIATGTVTASDASSVTLAVKEVTFNATVNGKPVDPFEVGVKTQLEWGR